MCERRYYATVTEDGELKLGKPLPADARVLTREQLFTRYYTLLTEHDGDDVAAFDGMLNELFGTEET